MSIKPCPFPSCASTHVRIVCSGSSWYVQCMECDANGPTIEDGEKDDTDKAIQAWNDVLRADQLKEQSK